MNVFSNNSKFTDYPLIRREAECKSGDELLSKNAKDVFACRTLCNDKAGCYFYLFGREGSTKEGWCWWEKTEIPKTADENKICSGKNEGWEEDEYDFYQALSMSITLKFYQNFHIF